MRLPLSRRFWISSLETPAASNCTRATTPCWRRAIRAMIRGRNSPRGGAYSHAFADYRQRFGCHRAGLLGALGERCLQAGFVGAQLFVALSHWAEVLDHFVRNRLLERSVLLTVEFALDLGIVDSSDHGHHLDQVRDARLVGRHADLGAGIGHGTLDLLGDALFVVQDVQRALL